MTFDVPFPVGPPPGGEMAIPKQDSVRHIKLQINTLVVPEKCVKRAPIEIAFPGSETRHTEDIFLILQSSAGSQRLNREEQVLLGPTLCMARLTIVGFLESTH
mmetsp:Transcript_32314/g.39122  ORF Transcript_32314/g.39122 Transcript_32314/m.39122 type:complete len:103 (-) Transcript_32314:44-352(-)